MSSNAKAMVLASFAGDSLALGAHWIYDTDVIDRKISRPDVYLDPQPSSYHDTKKAGEFTHYGDQTLLLLESVVTSSGFDLQHFAKSWRDMFDSYEGYFDGATRKTLENMAGGAQPDDAGSSSDDLAGAARIAPLAYCYRQDLKKLINSARAQTAFTHNQPHVVDAAEVLSTIAFDVLTGTSPRKAVAAVRSQMDSDDKLSDWLDRGLKSTAADTREAVKGFGQMCEIDAALPATIHLIAKYEDSLPEALIENVRAGGDSAGRGLIVGMILGAYQGLTAIPSRWLSEMKAHDRIITLIDKLDAASR